MATYAIGDIQGCYDDLQRLLERIQFDPTADHLWFVGDLVNRGPKSTQVLRFVKGLGERATTVLGNHDLHLLAVAIAGRRPKAGSSLAGVLNAPDREELLEWLRLRPLMHFDPALGFSMIHAGVAPQWSHSEALGYAAEVESMLRDDALHSHFFAHMYGDQPDRWRDDLQGMDRLRFITNC
ncbi:MAG: symmetrical bis(5'-nucleosyl)-tetraphosphatase, partial [Pseudomonadota bacterium]